MHQPNPNGLYDAIVGDRSYNYCNSDVPIRDAVIDKVVENHEGETTSVDIEAPDGTTHVISGDGTVPDKETLITQLDDATDALGSRPVSLLNNLFGVHLGPLHYTNRSAHFVVGDEVYEGNGQRGTDALPSEFEQLGVKVAHTLEGFQIAEQKQYHWKRDLSWTETQHEATGTLDALNKQNEHQVDNPDRVEESATPPVSNCWVINVPSIFPAQRFGQTLNAPSRTTIDLIQMAEGLFDRTLLTKRQAQCRAIQNGEVLIDDPNIDHDHSDDMEIETIIKKTFDLSDSGYRSLQSSMEKRKREAFQTVRRLAESDEFSFVMEEYAETIDELGELAMLGAKHREQQGKPPGFY